MIQKTLTASGHDLAAASAQLHVLNAPMPEGALPLPKFHTKLAEAQLYPLLATGIDVLQVNVGKLCNQTCRHCHVDAGPDRREVMQRETMELCIDVLRRNAIPTVDITGGAPEMNPHFRWFVQQVHSLGACIIVRCNLTIITANKQYNTLPTFFAEHGVQVVSSLPFYQQRNTDRQRGAGVFERSIRALQLLNAVGYGHENSGLQLDLVYNPAGAFLPGSQASLEADFRRELSRAHGVVFNNLYTITNMPISRFLEYLIESGNYSDYMEKLVHAFNPAAAAGAMCRSMLSVSWDGLLYDCDFNQMLEIPVSARVPRHIRDFDAAFLATRAIATDQHCYGCTAGSGSSCTGAIA